MKRKNRLLSKKRRSEAPQSVAATFSPIATSYSAPNTPLSKTKAHMANSASLLTKSEEPMKTHMVESPRFLRSRNSSTSSSISSGMKSPTSDREGFLTHHQLRSPVPHSSKPYRKHEKDYKPVVAPNQRKAHSSSEPSNKVDPSYFTVDRKTTQAEPETQANATKDKPDASSPPLSSSRLRRNISISTSSLDSTASTHSLADSTDGTQSQPGAGMKKHFKDYQNLADVPKAKRISSRHYKEQRKEFERKSRARSPGREEVDRMFGRERRRSRIIEAFEVPQTDQSNKENNEPAATAADGEEVSTPRDDAPKSPPDTSTPKETERRGRTISRRSTNMKQGTQTEQSRINSSALRRAKSLDRRSYDSITLSPELFNVKKGWLTMRDGGSGSWSKHWFVLGNNLLRYYCDSTSEDPSQLEGTIDLKKFVEVTEKEVQRNYGFEITTKDGNTLLAAMTSGIRKNWMRAIASAKPASEEADPPVPSAPAEAKNTEAKASEAEVAMGTDDASITERSQRRRARIRDRRKEGRARTFDFAEFRRRADEASNTVLSDRDEPPEITAKLSSDVKARSRTFDTGALLTDLGKNVANLPKPEPIYPSKELKKTKPMVPVKPADIKRSIESEWKKIEKIDYDSLLVNGTTSPLISPITETASMVKALQSEVDSLKKQMERVYSDRSSTSQDELLAFNASHSTLIPDDKHRLPDKSDQHSDPVEKLKQELSAAQESSRVKSAKLRECEMQLDIALTESQLVQRKLENALDELLLEKSRREEEEKEHQRKAEAFAKQLEASDVRLKKAETEALENQRRVRDLERQTSMQTNRDHEAARLQEHISVMRRHAEKQETETRELQGAYEQKCQSHKQVEDNLIEARELATKYERQLAETKQALRSTDNERSLISAHRQEAEADLKKLNEALKSAQKRESKLKDDVDKLVAQSQIDEDCNASLQDQLRREKLEKEKMKKQVEELKAGCLSSDEKRKEMEKLIKKLNVEAKESADQSDKLKQENEHLKDGLEKLRHSSEQSTRELRSRLAAAEKQLGDIDNLKSAEAQSSDSSFKAKVSELEAEMVDTGQMIAARLSALERPRRDSASSNSSDKDTSSHKMREKIQRLEAELEKKTAAALNLESSSRETEKRLKEQTKHDASGTEREDGLSLENKVIRLEEQLSATRTCLQHLHARALSLAPSLSSNKDPATALRTLLADTLRLASGDTDISSTNPEHPRSPSPTSDRQEPPRWQRVADPESRQQHQKVMSRLRQLTENLKRSDGRLVSPAGSPPLLGAAAHHLQEGDKSAKESDKLTDDQAAQLFAKQVSTQALLLAEMAATLRRAQSSPSLASTGPPPPQSKSRQSATSPQFTSAEFSDSIAQHAATGGLLQHVDALAQKLTLEGMLMREVARLRDAWTASRSRSGQHRTLRGGVHGECANAMLVHSHVSYVLQVYNERIARLSLEAKQARHRADAATRKLRELVDACKRLDVKEIGDLAVQIDTDPIAPPYSEIPLWEQQVDYGTLHGAHSVPSPIDTEVMFLDQEASFFQQLSEDLGSLSSNVQSLSELGAQLLATDGALQKLLSPSEISEHASVIAREAIVQAEIIYISHRLRRDYDDELRKAKAAISDQAQHFETFKKEVRANEEKSAGRLKRLTEEYNSKVDQLSQEAARVERARAEMSRDVEERLTRLSRKHEQELATCNAKHEQEMSGIRKDLSSAHHHLQVKTREYMEEVKALTEKLAEIKTKHSKEGAELQEDYERRLAKAKEECKREVKRAMLDEHEEEINDMKDEFDKRLEECDKIHKVRELRIEEEAKADKEDLIDKHEKEVRAIKKEHAAALAQLERDMKAKSESLKVDYDRALEEERRQHKVAMKNAREDAEVKTRDAIRRKAAELKKEHEKFVENRDKLQREQLEREKDEWTKQLKQQWDAEHEKELKRLAEEAASHVRSASMTSLSEGESKDVLRGRISDLEEQITSMQGQLEDEQKKHSYQRHFEELKALCDRSFAEIEETHAKQLKEMEVAHTRELERILESSREELENDKEDTKRAIEIMHKHHEEEVRHLRSQISDRRSLRGSDDESLRHEVENLNQEIEKLSEYYSKKCVELARATERIEKVEDKLTSLEREKHRLNARNEELAQQLQMEIKEMGSSTSADGEDKQAGDIYQLQVKLRVKSTEIDYLKQEVSSLSRQLEDSFKEKKLALRKHQTLFDDLTLARSKEALARRELARLKGHPRSDDTSDSDADRDKRPESSGGYDFQKSRSQPDIPAAPLRQKEPTSLATASVKRRSSDRAKRHAKV